MLQPPKPPSATPFPSSPAGSNFTPRKEFVHTPPHQASVFALLAFSSNNAIRLSNFPQPLVTALKSLLHAVIGLQSFRENAEHKLAEIILTGKPWSNSRSLSTEIILVQVFNVLVAHGYTFVSPLDYGREHSDRLSLAFSKLVPIHGRALQQPTQPHIVTFALSFPSPTVLRVVCPPLHATPAILQSVRGAWPRGVTNEKKLGEGCYEFKLKGYSWFSEDTFPEDALAHTLTILSALDRLDCKLLTSLALTASRPRNKDLWLFSAPGPAVASPADAGAEVVTEGPVHLGSPLKPSTYEPIVDHTAEGSGESEGTASAENRQHSKFAQDGHARFPSEPVATLRKRNQQNLQNTDESMHAPSTPHAPLPSRDITLGRPPDNTFPIPPLPRPSLLSRAQVETIHVSDLPQHFPRQDPFLEPQHPLGAPPAHPLVSLPEATERHPADEDFSHNTLADMDENAHSSTTSTPTVRASELLTSPLLPPAAFRTPTNELRDSTATGNSFEVPIAWVPPVRPPPSAFLNIDKQTDADGSSITTGPLPPGAWASTPVEEMEDFMVREEETGADALPRTSDAMPERHDVLSPRSPEIVSGPLPDDDAGRKSEVGLLDVMPSSVRENKQSASVVPQANEHPGGHAARGAAEPKEGWVFVSVGTTESSHPVASTAEVAAPAPIPDAQPSQSHVAIPVAQLVAAADAIENAPRASTPVADSPAQSGIGRLFARSSRKEGGVQKTRGTEEADSEKIQSGRFRRKGGVLQTLRSGKRSAID